MIRLVMIITLAAEAFEDYRNTQINMFKVTALTSCIYQDVSK